MTVKSFIMLLSFLLLFSLVQPKLLTNLQRSSEIRGTVSKHNRKIDALWYKGRGIRPVGRFGRRIVKTTRGVYYGQQSICSSCRDPDATRD
ncbi:prolactin-releasing peptide isoform X1 [Astyanax mexicanus]|uniref:Prolactin-releasing peptide isoform X1 n=1 Tax=Astyanax mexicanus TaxID=7994 RepID=A0A8T2LQB2_ASTMX|nr:prolactin-releasing peptide isoform X1 [Astyanax mexicanus]